MEPEQLKKYAAEIKRRTEVEKGMTAARERQLHLLPKLPEIKGYSFGCCFQPCADISGDFFDFICLNDHQIGIALGDVSGHGFEAGIIMGMAKKALHIHARGRSEAKEVLGITNIEISNDLAEGVFVSAAYGVLDVKERSFNFARAGNNPPYLINPNRPKPLLELDPRGMALGIDRTGRRFPEVMDDLEIPLKKGDLIFQYTDGVVEAKYRKKKTSVLTQHVNMIKEGEEFGEKRLKDLLMSNYTQPVQTIIEVIRSEVSDFVNKEPDDDITMIAFRYENT